MEDFLKLLQQHIDVIEHIGNKIEKHEAYMEELKEYLPTMNQMITTIFNLVQSPEIPLSINQEFVLQVLKDIVDGMEREDSVFLLDVLRYGLLEIYYYVGSELQDGACYE